MESKGKWVKVKEPNPIPKGNYEMIEVPHKFKGIPPPGPAEGAIVYRFDAATRSTWVLLVAELGPSEWRIVEESK
jgi:hypothetical protein